LILQSFESADSGANDHTETVSPFEVFDINPTVLHRHFGCGHRKVRKSIGTAEVLRIFEEWFRIETADLSPDFAIVSGGIESIDCTNAADSVFKIGPKRLDVVAKRCDCAETSENNSAIGHGV